MVSMQILTPHAGNPPKALCLTSNEISMDQAGKLPGTPLIGDGMTKKLRVKQTEAEGKIPVTQGSARK